MMSMRIKLLEKMTSKVTEILFIAEIESIHSKRFVKTLTNKFNVDEFYLRGSALHEDVSKFGNSKCIIACPLTSGINSIPNNINLPIIGICMALEINEDSKDPKINIQLKKNVSRCRAIVCDSGYIEKVLRDNFDFKGDILRIVYGCDQSIFLPVALKNSNTLRIISTRNWTPVHSNGLLVDALKILEEKGINFKASFYGKGIELNKTEISKIKQFRNNQVTINGQFLNSFLPTIFQEHEIYISTSVSDGTSVSLIEALSAGRICICRDFPSNREWIIHGETGYLFTDLNDLVEILVILNNMDFNNKMNISEAAKRYVLNRGDWKTNAPKFLNLVSRYVS
ncbi:glycosyltransferase family 1 protein [bacterium]|nr:glycosyltransferase family 1 protein [bacterium]